MSLMISSRWLTRDTSSWRSSCSLCWWLQDFCQSADNSNIIEMTFLLSGICVSDFTKVKSFLVPHPLWPSGLAALWWGARTSSPGPAPLAWEGVSNKGLKLIHLSHTEWILLSEGLTAAPGCPACGWERSSYSPEWTTPESVSPLRHGHFLYE